MKNKYYIVAIVFFFLFGKNLFSQCNVAINSLVVNGTTVSASASGIGNIFPWYEWFWDDGTTSGTSNPNTQHTYAKAGSYQVCVTYSDSAHPFNCISADCDSLFIAPLSVHATENAKTEIKSFPNPFTSIETISLSLSQETDVTITVFDLTGKEVAVLQNGILESGIHMITWKPEDLPGGIYFMEVKAGNFLQTKKLIFNSSEE